ncbi:PREDICTED: uncharacterized protein LOC104606817 [Nelumbo nucifera]|uniref:Uncharacterized protein LOC104606817 n=1 Tax=Nelumbo nucifera TaxID=4432 RepID=A0A1U8QA01_NELNU|nr:PREDICTED: uncharacterized protein LOC104606817 [Nelumbo nucifera]
MFECVPTSSGTPEQSKKQSPCCQETMIASSIGIRKLALEEGRGKWEHRMVLMADRTVRDWTKVLDAVAERLGLEGDAVVLPFDEKKAILDTGTEKLSFNTVQVDGGLIQIQNWVPLCNEVVPKDCSFRIKLLGLPFNLWNEQTLGRIVRALGGVLLELNLRSLRAVEIKVAGMKPENLPRAFDILSDGAWYRVWLASEVEASLWGKRPEVGDDGEVAGWSTRGTQGMVKKPAAWERAKGENEQLHGITTSRSLPLKAINSKFLS